ncbi:MAG: hypothetical protein KF768_02255 [Phycisphaeraceae bacterium]|nr:hypothetical protein [Phycisphaeraceae bacterium]
MSSRLLLSLLLSAGLIGLVVASRLLVHEPNFAAAGAVALFSGFVFRNRALAVGTPLAAMLVSDLAIGMYTPAMMAGVYVSLALAVGLGWLVRRQSTLGRRAAAAAGATVVGSCVFFVVSNFFVWMAGYYGHTAAGLAECYTLAVPFFRNTLASDALFSAGLFGLYGVSVALRGRSVSAARAAHG